MPFMKRLRVIAAICLLLAAAPPVNTRQLAPLRPPAVPLVTHDPYFSVWSFSDALAGDRTRHWTGAFHGMVGMARVDGKSYRLMGQSYGPLPEPMRQTRLEVLPTRTVYEFEGGGVRVQFTFLSPLLPHDLDLMSRPVTYVTWEVKAIDGRSHEVSLYFDCTAEFAVNTTYEKVVWSRLKAGELRVMTFGSQLQPVLERSGDDLRIDWGYLHLALPPSWGGSDVIAWNQTARRSFATTGTLPDSDDTRMPRDGARGDAGARRRHRPRRGRRVHGLAPPPALLRRPLLNRILRATLATLLAAPRRGDGRPAQGRRHRLRLDTASVPKRSTPS